MPITPYKKLLAQMSATIYAGALAYGAGTWKPSDFVNDAKQLLKEIGIEPDV